MSTTYTTNYHLGKQTDTSDIFDMSVITDNMDIIDKEMNLNKSSNLYSNNAWTEFETGFINQNGTITTTIANGEKTSQYIPAKAGQKFTLTIFNKSDASPWIAIAYYNSSKNFINRDTYATNTTVDGWNVCSKTFEAPVNTAYIRVSARLYHAGRASLVVGEQPPYIIPPQLGNCFGRLFPPRILDSSGYRYPYIDTNEKTITFPEDTLIVDTRLKNDSYKSIPRTVVSYATITGTSSVCIYYDTTDDTIKCGRFDKKLDDFTYIPICNIRSDLKTFASSCPMYLNGRLYGVIPPSTLNYNSFVKSINHRGYCNVAPENTLPAFKLSKQYGFEYVETDIEFTSDSVPVLLHDTTVDRTSDGAGAIADMTFEQVRELDFGSWKSEKYAGTQIPSWEEFIILCRNLGLKIYAELKNSPSQTQIDTVIAIAKKYNMEKNISWISFSSTSLERVLSTLPKARVGYLSYAASSNAITTCASLKTLDNDVFLDCSSITSAIVTDAQAANIPVEMWGVKASATITNADAYVSGFTADAINAAQLLIDNATS